MKFEEIEIELLEIASEVGARADIPIEAEQFFSEIVEGFKGSREECLAFVRANVSTWFRCIDARPEWIQEPEWHFSDGRPMVFVGQVNVPVGRKIFHDDAAFYLFWQPETGETKTVIQVA